MIIRNISDKDFNFSFDFNTYFIPKNRTLEVSKELGDFLAERWPTSFGFDIEVKKPVAQVKGTPSRSLISREAEDKTYDTTMRVSPTRINATFGSIDQSPASGTTDKDGVEWVGEGLVYE